MSFNKYFSSTHYARLWEFNSEEKEKKTVSDNDNENLNGTILQWIKAKLKYKMQGVKTGSSAQHLTSMEEQEE